MLFFEEYLIYGGYPKVILEEDIQEKKTYLKELYTSLLKKDILESGIKDETKFYHLLKILASQTGRLVNKQELSVNLGISNDTVDKFLYILEKSFIIKLIKPFYRNVRKELSKMSKVYFLDNGYRNIILNTFSFIPERLDSGNFIENSFFIEIVKNSIERINYWRTQDKNEIDFILDEQFAFELKLSSKKGIEKKYTLFQEKYPEILFNFVFYNDNFNLDLLDFSC